MRFAILSHNNQIVSNVSSKNVANYWILEPVWKCSITLNFCYFWQLLKTGVPFENKNHLSRYRDAHYKGKVVPLPCNHYNGKLYFGTTSSYWSHLTIFFPITSSRNVFDNSKGLERDIHGPLTRYVKLQVAHAPGMPGTFSYAADFNGNRYLATPACITARAWRTCRDACRDRLHAVTGKRKTSPAFPAHAHPQICVSGKRPMAQCSFWT